MNIIQPNKKISKEVETLTEELNKDIVELEEMIKVDSFANGMKGFAIAHCQVSENPYRIFVAKRGVLPNSVVINPKIVEEGEPYTAKERCLSFPFREEKKVKRYFKIKVEYQDRYLDKTEQNFEGLQAQIFQHEIQHFNGQNIYDN